MEYDYDAFRAAAAPLVEWLNKNCNPHVAVVVTPNGAELLEAALFAPIGEFVPD